MPTELFRGLAYLAVGLTSRNNSQNNTRELGHQESFFAYCDWVIRELSSLCHPICQQNRWHTPSPFAQKAMENAQGPPTAVPGESDHIHNATYSRNRESSRKRASASR